MVLLVLAVALVYGNALDGPFFLDDIDNIALNPAIRQLWPLTKALNPPPADMGYFTRPVINLTMCMNYASGALQFRSYHVTNIGLHAAAVLSLFLLLAVALRTSGYDERAAYLLALATALIWAVHTLNTSTVNYVAQRGELAIALGLFLLLYFLHRAVIGWTDKAAGGGHPGWLAGAFLAGLLGMGSKENMAVAPFLAAAYDRIFLTPSWKEVFRQRGLFYLLLAATIIWPLSKQLAHSPHVPVEGYVAAELWRYPLMQAWGLARMIRLSLWPRPLIIDYGMDMPSRISEVWPALLLVLFLIGMAVWALKHSPRVGFLGLFFFAVLAPSSTVFPVLGQPVAEHRMYAPLAALIALAVLGLYELLGQRFEKNSPRHRRIFMGLVGLATLALGWESHRRNEVYQDLVRLWSDAAAKRPTNGRAWNNLGFSLLAAGRFEESLEACQTAARLQPYLAQPQSNLGNALCALGRYEEALAHYREALRINPGFGLAHSNLGRALSALGRHEEALAEHNLALRLDPRNAEVHFSIAVTLMKLDRHEQALDHLRAAVQLKPDYFEAISNMGNCLKALNRPHEAAACYRQVLRQHPDSIPAAGNLGKLLIEEGRSQEALRVFQEAAAASRHPVAVLGEFATGLIANGLWEEGLALSLHVLRWQPNHPLALNNSAWIMATSTNPALQDANHAVKNAEAAVRLFGEQTPRVLGTLAAAYAAAGRFEEALATARRAADMARQQGDEQAALSIEKQAAFYAQGRPWRE